MDGNGNGANGWRGRDLHDAKAEKIGTVTGAAYARPRFGTSWLLVETATGRTVVVPAGEIKQAGDRLTLPYPRGYVEGGPSVEPGRRLSRAEERRLCLHYGLDDELPGGSGCGQGCGLCGTRRKG